MTNEEEMITECPYCHAGENHKPMDVSIVDFGMLGEYYLTINLREYGYLTMKMEDSNRQNVGQILVGTVKYCPMCGRKLKDDTESNN